MTRPLRIELAGGLYHVTSRGDRREDIYLDDPDRRAWLTILGEVCERVKGDASLYAPFVKGDASLYAPFATGAPVPAGARTAVCDARHLVTAGTGERGHRSGSRYDAARRIQAAALAGGACRWAGTVRCFGGPARDASADDASIATGSGSAPILGSR